MSTCMRAAVALCMFWLRLRYYLHNSIWCKITGPASCLSAAGTPNFYPAVGMYEGCPLVYVLIPDMTLSLFRNWICRKMTGPASCISTAGSPKFLSGCRHAWQLPLFRVYTCWLRILMIWCRTAASPLPLHWRCCGLALDHPCDVLYAVTQIQSYHYGMCVLIPNTIVLSLHNSTCKKNEKIIITGPASCFSTAGSPKFLSGCRHAWERPLFRVYMCYIDGLLPDCCISTATALEMLQPCTGPLIPNATLPLWDVCVSNPNTTISLFHNSICRKIMGPTSCFSTAGTSKLISGCRHVWGAHLVLCMYRMWIFLAPLLHNHAFFLLIITVFIFN